MYSLDNRKKTGYRKLLVALTALAFTAILVLTPPSEGAIISRWNAPIMGSNHIAISGEATAGTEPKQIDGDALPVVSPLDLYNRESTLVEADANKNVSYYRRDLDHGGTIHYFVVMLGPQTHIEVINADGATPGSDATGDTIWLDGQKHLATVAEMVQAPYAVRDGMELLGAMAFGFHGDIRTSDEGSVVINGVVLRVNPGRAVLCITSDGIAKIGLFDATAIRECQQANGAGPVVLWKGKIANPSVSSETDIFLPFNPLREDFVLIDWRRKIYSGLFPKSVVGVGQQPNGRSYLIMTVSYGVTGIDLISNLKAMGCTEALGGDDDNSTQAVWRGVPVHSNEVRGVPDALAVYLRN